MGCSSSKSESVPRSMLTSSVNNVSPYEMNVFSRFAGKRSTMTTKYSMITDDKVLLATSDLLREFSERNTKAKRLATLKTFSTPKRIHLDSAGEEARKALMGATTVSAAASPPFMSLRVTTSAASVNNVAKAYNVTYGDEIERFFKGGVHGSYDPIRLAEVLDGCNGEAPQNKSSETRTIRDEEAADLAQNLVSGEGTFSNYNAVEFITLFKCKGKGNEDKLSVDGTMHVYALLDRTQDYKVGAFMRETRLRQSELVWVMCVEDYPLWLSELAQEGKRAPDAGQSSFGVTNMLLEFQEGKVNWLLRSNDRAWQYFQKVDFEGFVTDTGRYFQADPLKNIRGTTRDDKLRKQKERCCWKEAFSSEVIDAETSMHVHPEERMSFRASSAQMLATYATMSREDIPPHLPQVAIHDMGQWSSNSENLYDGVANYKVAGCGHITNASPDDYRPNTRLVYTTTCWMRKMSHKPTGDKMESAHPSLNSFNNDLCIWNMYGATDQR